MTNRKHPTVFVSHTSGDLAFARKLTHELERQGASVFLDADLAPGANFGDWVNRSIKNSDVVVFVVPPHEGSGRGALMELGAAKALNKPIFPLMPDRARMKNSGALGNLFDYQVLDATIHSNATLAQRIISSANELLVH